eukprot:CAMPEP_0114116684 /NCGR_PEP_ID=MMETSP0043_2-20121206/4627_1 /TAXON_ID=464988 /ORGANISM="Hemiselmis andersenii, Strain CCMP644" /LENGTH=118 /DNA_ID=CAMNT_0001209017 /DNA_START=758 /DNA_END=1114 /DNA_ORIENTATION=+
MAIFPADVFQDVKTIGTIGSVIAGFVFSLKMLVLDPSLKPVTTSLQKIEEGQEKLKSELEKKIEEGQEKVEKGQEELKTELNNINIKLTVVDSHVQGFGRRVDKLDDRVHNLKMESDD